MNSEVLFYGKYKVLRTLGKGGMGTVYLAENVGLGTLWAIKEIRKQPGSGMDLLVEPNILKRLNHPALPRIFDIFEDEIFVYIIVDYIEGISLDKELEKVGRFPEQVVINWAKQIGNVLQYLHSCKPNPIIYRDMKPSNIILTTDGNIKLIDFGIAREYKDNSDSDTFYIGTRGYAAPEQYGTGQSSATTDIYSLGVTLYHLLTGLSPNQPPYEIQPVRLLDPSLSPEIEAVIYRCTRPNPDERYPSVQELMQDIDSIGNKKRQSPQKSMSFKRLILAVSGSAEFAGEFAYVAARACGLKVAVIDLDYFASNLDMVLAIQYPPENIKGGQYSRLQPVKQALKEGLADVRVIEESCAVIDRLDNLHVLTACGEGKPEDFSADIIDKLIELTYSVYDMTVVVLGRRFYDAAVQASLGRADYHIIAAPGNVDSIREFEKYLVHMQESKGISIEKARFIAWDYKKGINLPVNLLKKVYHGQAFLGCVSYDPERESCKNVDHSFYAKQAYKRLVEEYRGILEGFNLMPRATLAEKLGRLIPGITRKKA